MPLDALAMPARGRAQKTAKDRPCCYAVVHISYRSAIEPGRPALARNCVAGQTQHRITAFPSHLHNPHQFPIQRMPSHYRGRHPCCRPCAPSMLSSAAVPHRVATRRVLAAMLFSRSSAASSTISVTRPSLILSPSGRPRPSAVCSSSVLYCSPMSRPACVVSWVSISDHDPALAVIIVIPPHRRLQ